jgi:hypothetical protein
MASAVTAIGILLLAFAASGASARADAGALLLLLSVLAAVPIAIAVLIWQLIVRLRRIIRRRYKREVGQGRRRRDDP